MAIFNTTGTIRYTNNWAVLDIDQGIVDYYYSLIPKYYYTQRQMYPAHITVVRKNPIEVISPDCVDMWGRYSGDEIGFSYSNHIYFETPYFYLKAWSRIIERIRTELGLPATRTDYDCYHITIGNVKLFTKTE